MSLKKNEYLLPKLSNTILDDLKVSYKETREFSDDNLSLLYSIYGDVLIEAFVMLDNDKLYKYTTESGHKTIFKWVQRQDYFYVFDDTNFCHCNKFQQVLNKTEITCKHVLAVKLAEIKGAFVRESLSDSQFVELLNSQVGLSLEEKLI